MALATILHLVGAAELDKLRARPTWINHLRLPDGYTYLTYYACSINYFIVGNSYPRHSSKRPLTGMLFGFSYVTCPTLENGNFGVVAPHQVRRVLEAFGSLDLGAARRRIEQADADELEEEEVDDYELLLEEAGDPAAEDGTDGTAGARSRAAAVIEAELLSLVDYYKRAARGRHAIVSYTT